jgi:hypothetical protein
MRDDDIATMRNADEIFTRDFLRAMQICDIIEFNIVRLLKLLP